MAVQLFLYHLLRIIPFPLNQLYLSQKSNSNIYVGLFLDSPVPSVCLFICWCNTIITEAL